MTISKTSFLAGFQCHKLLWKRLNEPEAFPAVDQGKQAIFDQGQAIGDLAKSLYPGGIEVGEGMVPRKSVVAETTELLGKRLPLYEPAFVSPDGGFVRVDVLLPDGEDAWRIVEVKSSTGVNDVNLLDVAFQLHVCRTAGLTITRCALMHVNSGYVRHGEIDAQGLLVEEDVTDAAEALIPDIPARLAELRTMTAEPVCPAVAIGAHCTKPYSCDLRSQCWAFLPDYPVTDLYRDTKGHRWKFLNTGVHALADVPDPGILNFKQQRQVKAVRNGEAHVAPTALKAFLKKLTWPLAYFDIETSSSATPFYDGTRPYQQIPFQFSLHVQETKDGPITHHEFLAAGQSDPRPEFLSQLHACLPTMGTIVAYNASFEKRCLRESAAAYPQHAWAAGLEPRFVDLLEPFRNFSYYHRDQHGSASIKAVLPALDGRDYSHLNIKDGNAAARAFATTEFTNIPADERDQIRRDLLAYCQLDTQAMIDLIDALSQHCGS